jgi:predicted RNase H-like nuclease (RuvC/YqgF family)
MDTPQELHINWQQSFVEQVKLTQKLETEIADLKKKLTTAETRRDWLQGEMNKFMNLAATSDTSAAVVDLYKKKCASLMEVISAIHHTAGKVLT